MKNQNLLSKISLMFLVLLLLSSCYEGCVPAFPDDLAKWLPYEGVSKIEFISDDDSVLSFDITVYEKSEKFCYDTRYLYAPPHPKLELSAIDTIANFAINCTLYITRSNPNPAIVNSDPFLISRIWSTEDIDSESVADIDNRYISFDELFSFDIYYQNENKTEERKLFEILDSLNIGGVIYNDVYQLCRYSDQYNTISPKFVTIYIVKGIGIIGLEEVDGTMWALKN